MMNKKNYFRQYALFVLFLLAFTACKKDPEVEPTKPGDEPSLPSNQQLNAAIYGLMKEWYLWNDQLPVIQVKDYATPEKLLEALRYKGVDRWSYVEDVKTFDQYFTGGQYVGHGFGMKLDADGYLRVTYVYKDSPMDRQGVTRGAKLLKLNGKDIKALIDSEQFGEALGDDKAGVQNTFQVRELSGNVRDIVLAKEAVNMNTVLQRDVREVKGKKVGYLMFTSFIEKSKAELDEAFSYFRNEGISELVLDLRYNGGGSLQVAQHLADLISSQRTSGKLFVQLTYNSKKQDQNSPFNFSSAAQAINIDRLFVITSRSSASASEAIINGLRPYMPVYTIGSKTSGKPVGMNVWRVGGYALVPITFKVANADGKAEYFDGIEADGSAGDDLDALLGDGREDCMAQALYYIENNKFSGSLAAGRREDAGRQLQLTGFRAEIGAF